MQKGSPFGTSCEDAGDVAVCAESLVRLRNCISHPSWRSNGSRDLNNSDGKAAPRRITGDITILVHPTTELNSQLHLRVSDHCA